MTIPQSRSAINPQTVNNGDGIPITITIDGRRRTAGFAMPNGFWYRRMDRSRHFYRAGGESINAGRAALAEAQRLGCVACKVVDSESGDTYLCRMEDYARYGRPVQRAGWEPQIALSLTHWQIIRRDGTQVSPVHELRSEATAEQMNLFQAVTE